MYVSIASRAPNGRGAAVVVRDQAVRNFRRKTGCVAAHLKIEEFEGKSRIFTIRGIRQEVEKVLAVLEGRKADSQEIIQYLRDVLAFVTGKPPPLEESVSEDLDEDGADEEQNFSEAKREYEEM